MLMRLLVLGLLALANASPGTSSIATNAISSRVNDFDMVMSGQYTVTNCGKNTNLVVNLLNKLYSALLTVIQDAESSNSSPAYKAFFKDPSYAPFISTLFTNVTTGVPMTRRNLYSLNGAVTFVCVTAPDQFTFTLNGPRDAYDECLANPTTTSNYIGFKPPMPYVILCPSFFTSNVKPVPPPNTCLTISTYINRFHGNGQSLWLYQMWILLQMITHYYLYTSTGIFDITNTNDVNKCFRLPAKQSCLNANNYVYYAASVYGNCKDFPTPPANGRELLEVDIEDPSDDGLDDPSPAAVEYVATDLEIDGQNITGSP